MFSAINGLGSANLGGFWGDTLPPKHGALHSAGGVDTIRGMKSPTLAIDGRLANAPQRAGVGTFCTELLRALPEECGEWRLRVYLDAPPRDGFPLDASQAELVVLPRVRLWTQRALASALEAEPPEAYLSPVPQLPWRCPCPSLAMIMDLAYVTHPEHFTLRQRLQNRLQTRWVVWRATRLLALSECTRRDLARLYAVDPAKTIVTLAGPAPLFQGAAARVIDPTLPTRYVLYVGRLQPRKNIARLIEAFTLVRARNPLLPQHLVIAGDPGWLHDGIYAAGQASPARDFIHFLGFVPENGLPGLIAGADVLALVSLWEGFGLPVIEAMACGTAVLTSNTSALPEVAGDAALQVDPHNTEAIAAGLERLLVDDALRTEVAARGPAQAARFSWGATARRVMQAVESVLPSR